ncbi:ABC transporter ATP-binding protein [Rhizobium sp.]
MNATSRQVLLEVDGLNVTFPAEAGHVHAVRDVGFRLGRERLAIVGESGSGKSTIMRAMLGLLPARAKVEARRARFHGSEGTVDIDRIGGSQLRRLRGRHIGMIVQDPKQGLNPLRRIDSQVLEAIRIDQPAIGRKAAAQRVIELLAEVKINDPERVARSFPHELSGGMAQRVMIAMMLAARPELLIADEATSALDMLVQRRILELIDAQVTARGMGLILISHDIDLVSRFADRILVMYRGRIVEELAGGDGLLRAVHPYTKGLLACRPHPGTIGQLLPTLQRDPAWLA